MSLTLTRANIDSSFPTTVRNFAIELPSFSTSGYSWYVLRNPSLCEGWNVVFRNRNTSKYHSNVIGCSGTEIYTLHLTKAPKAGDVLQIPFILARPFDLDGTLNGNPQHYVYRIRFR